MNSLPIVLKTTEEKHLYEQIYEYIKDEICAGKLLSGEKLPSTRSLAEHLLVSRSTVDLAYEQLLSEGYLESVPCRGYFVQGTENLVRMQTNIQTSKVEKIKKQKKYQYDFSPNGMDKGSFPFETWKKVNKNTLADERMEMFVPGIPQGELELRKTLVQYLYASRGVKCSAEQIIVGAGNDYLLMLLEKIFRKKKRVALENPSYPKAYKSFQSFGYEVYSVPMDKNGIDMEKLKSTDADLVYIMPSHQYPTGIIMPIGRRMELIQWAFEKEDRYLIEDDYDSEFRYRGKLIPAMQGVDNAGKVIYMGTFSKSIAPSIRISFMVLPPKLLTEYHKNCAFFSSTVSRIDQNVLKEFIAGGYYERHINRMRKIYKEKHDCLVNECKLLQDDFEIYGDNAGLHIVLQSKGAWKEAELVKAAAEKSVKVYGMSEYTQDVIVEQMENNVERASILLGYGGLSIDEIKEGMKRFRDAINEK